MQDKSEITKFIPRREITRELATLIKAGGSSLDQLCGLATRLVAELLVEIGGPRRLTEGGFARRNGTAPFLLPRGKEMTSRSVIA